MITEKKQFFIFQSINMSNTKVATQTMIYVGETFLMYFPSLAMFSSHLNNDWLKKEGKIWLKLWPKSNDNSLKDTVVNEQLGG